MTLTPAQWARAAELARFAVCRCASCRVRLRQAEDADLLEYAIAALAHELRPAAVARDIILARAGAQATRLLAERAGSALAPRADDSGQEGGDVANTAMA